MADTLLYRRVSWNIHVLRQMNDAGLLNDESRKRLEAIGFPFERNGKSIACARPDLAELWHPEKNGGLTPENVTVGSRKKVWWRHWHEGTRTWHEWQTSPTAMSRRKSDTGCPYCSGKKVLSGFNDLATLRPDVAKFWHPKKNGDLKPNDVPARSSRKYWWLCPYCGHEEFGMIKKRPCPKCCKRNGLIETSLATKRPDLATEWHPEKNGDLTPGDVTLKSQENVWWRHWHEGARTWHEWRATICSRAEGAGCPYCSGLRVLPGFNDLATLRPDVAKFWHPEKNGDLTPREVAPGSNRKVWWLCPECGDEFQRRVRALTKVDANPCLRCRAREVRAGKSVADDEELMKWFYPDGNPGIEPKEIHVNSERKLKWRCPEGHVFESSPANISHADAKCPVCSMRIVVAGANDLATTHPAIAAEWHPTKNGGLKPTDVSANSHKQVWWKCSVCGKEWRTTPAVRTLGYGETRDKPGCNACKNSAGRVVCVETGDMYPSAAAAARALGLTTSTMYAAVDKPNRTCGGFHWRHAS